MGLREYQRPPASELVRRLNVQLALIDWHLDLSRERLGRYREPGRELSLLVQRSVVNRQLDARLAVMAELRKVAPDEG